MAVPDSDRRAGPKVGTRTAFTFFADVLPGHEKALREGIEADQRDPRSYDVIREIATLHEFRWVLFDEDRRVMFCSSFDGPWDVYIQDFVRSAIGQMIDKNLAHVGGGWVGIKDPGASDWLLAHAVPAPYYGCAYPEPPVKKIWKALAVEEAFQQVLDDPAAAQALKDPALKPLLDVAAD
jgi:hypothetical protein